ncbi:GlcG/HbpS family heme-binding protein [Mycobacterium intracellulare]|uniref:GlcG/HbpS family heme-binding protein n=1 Tax=Mycobacterium intracellulare TaxID=1767 RepID=UPI001EEE1C33|nr:heme-binding protein [Mycobacterium intracellulare]MEE3750861.1 heme-binding protein [Mycobacterium intracellulare]
MQTIRRIGTREAERVIAGARRRAGQIGVPMCIAVVDESGTLVQFIREDGAKLTSVSIAIDKAFTGAGARNLTSFYGQVSQPGAPAWGIDKTNGGRFSVIGGGAPIVENGVVVGGVGVSGGTASQDEDVALAGVAELESTDANLTTVGRS